jgi:serine O-acetyltransferase
MGAEDTPVLAPVVDALCRSATGLSHRPSGDGRLALPSRDAVVDVIEQLRSVLFPGYFGDARLGHESLHFYVGATLDRALENLEEQVKRGLCFDRQHDPSACVECEAKAREVTRKFLGRLPEVQSLLVSDVRAAYEGDPALRTPAEAIFCYPGMLAITNARIAHELFVLDVPLIPRIITEHAHSLTGIDIHPGARIGASFFIDHGTGVVIGETSVIGSRVRLYQGVTLGAKSFPLDQFGKPIKGIARHPVVEDDVIVYSGATILGRVTIGRGATIGGNVWLTDSVPPGARVTQASPGGVRFDDGAGI